MVKRYHGGLISANSALTTTSSTSGVFDTSQQLQASQEGLWPVANNTINSTSGTIFDSTRQIINGEVIQYKYHLFLSTSVFTCTGNGTVDIICVGGGGGGGGGQSGGGSGDGGSGGNVVVISNRAITANSYTVTVGGAGTGGAEGANGTAGTTSSVTGIAGATASGGARGKGGSQSGRLAGNGAGGNYTGTATATSAFTAGIGLGVTFFNLVDLSGNSISTWRFDAKNSLIYFGSGGVSGWATTSSAGTNLGNASLGGGGGNITTTTFGNTGINNTTRSAVINTGGGGVAGIRAGTIVTAGNPGGSGFVAIRYKI